uniref:Uncharacterized protein n=1 Tax=Oryza brachyantha TaxID=4533 RepID=J3LX26_ORYBR
LVVHSTIVSLFSAPLFPLLDRPAQKLAPFFLEMLFPWLAFSSIVYYCEHLLLIYMCRVWPCPFPAPHEM